MDDSIIDRRIVRAETMRAPAGQVIRWLIEHYMAEEGWSAGEIDEGPVIEMPFHFLSLRECFWNIKQHAGGAIWLEFPASVNYRVPKEQSNG